MTDQGVRVGSPASSIALYNTGTMNSVISSMVIPPSAGSAITPQEAQMGAQ